MNKIQSRKYQANILIVDDIPDNIRFLSAFLSDQGYQVRKALNGQMALIAIAGLAPDLILLDVNLPGMNGYEICSSLKQNPDTCSIPIIFLSAGDGGDDKVKAFQVGAADYITKPFYLEEALARVQTQLTIQNLQKELKNQNAELRQALDDLKIAQINLVQQEKMATLRKVVAGVAHEINNPLSFISCNIQPTEDYIKQLLTLIDLYQQEQSPKAVVNAYLNEIDLEFMTSDLINILKSMKNGAERIRTVILALRIFIRLDESGVKPIDLHENIDNVLALLRHRFTAREDGMTIQIKSDYGALPLVTCHADQMNQAIFNLLCNAIDAIDEKISKNAYQELSPEIAIVTRRSDPSTVTICIKDNGVGIAEAHQQEIFEPFFTTKPAGQGIGLGLATSRRIIEDTHGGQLTYTAAGREGSEFTIQIPIQIPT